MLLNWLASVRLEKYIPVFKNHEITDATFVLLKQNDLEKMGIPLGPQKQILQRIAELQQMQQLLERNEPYSYEDAPTLSIPPQSDYTRITDAPPPPKKDPLRTTRAGIPTRHAHTDVQPGILSCWITQCCINKVPSILQTSTLKMMKTHQVSKKRKSRKTGGKRTIGYYRMSFLPPAYR